MRYVDSIKNHLPTILQEVKIQIKNDKTIYEFVKTEEELDKLLSLQEKLIQEYLYDFQKNILDEKKCMQFYKDLKIPYAIVVRSLNYIRKEVIIALDKEGVDKETIIEFSEYFDKFINLTAKVYLKKDIVTLKKLRNSYFEDYLLFKSHISWVESIIESISEDDISKFPLIAASECKFEEYLNYPESLMVCIDVNLCMYLHDLHSLLHKLSNTFYLYYAKSAYSEAYMIFKDLKEQILKFKGIIGELYFITYSNLEVSFFKLIEIYKTNKKEFVTLIDMKSLKSLNSIYGEETITKALEVIEKRLHRFFEKDQARSLVVKGMTANFYMLNIDYSYDEYKKMIDNIIEIIKEPVILDENKIEFTPIIAGLEIEEYFDIKKDEMIMILNHLKNKAKQSKCNKLLVINHYSKEMLKSWLKNRYDSKFIKSKIENAELKLAYHPIFDIQTNKIYSLEILARIVDEDKLIPAGLFIDEVYSMNLIEKLDLAVLRKLIEDKEKIKQITDKIFINVSFNSLLNEEYLEKLEKLIDNIQVGLLLELTEQKFVDNVEILFELNQKYNLFFAVDDFGTGYTSLQSVVDLVKKGILKVLKIDGSLIKNIDDEYNKKIINVISNMAKELNLLSVAEYVESEEILNEIKKAGINLAQGYFLAKPALIEELIVEKVEKFGF
ncbi:EAL domain-containing protein [Caminibacter pacificus]